MLSTALLSKDRVSYKKDRRGGGVVGGRGVRGCLVVFALLHWDVLLGR